MTKAFCSMECFDGAMRDQDTEPSFSTWLPEERGKDN